MTTATTAGLAGRVDALDWHSIEARLDDTGHAVTEPLLGAGECEDLAGLFDGGRFRSTIDMARHRFGDGRYRYFEHPLPEPISQLRAAFYRRLAPVANAWAERLRGEEPRFPTRQRPNRGRNGDHRIGMRHGVSTVTRGSRTALGIIFHDSR